MHTSDDGIAAAMKRLDERIIHRMAQINRYVVDMDLAGKGDGVEEHSRWINQQQQNPKSIYHCYEPPDWHWEISD